MKYARKALLAALLACACLTGCSSRAGQNFGEFVADRQAQRAAANPSSAASGAASAESVAIETYQNGNFGPSLGFDITTYPSNNTLSAVKFFALDGWFSQIEFVSSENQHLVLRTAFTDAGYLTITYKELHDGADTTRTLNGTEIRTRDIKDGCTMVTWTQGEFQFLLHTSASQGPPSTALVDMVVSGTRAQAV